MCSRTLQAIEVSETERYVSLKFSPFFKIGTTNAFSSPGVFQQSSEYWYNLVVSIGAS